MAKGTALTAAVTVGALAVVMAVFANNSSPYVTVAQAKGMAGADNLHLVGTILKPTVRLDVARHRLRFDLKDDAGEVVSVEHTGTIPANLQDATKLVAIGGFQSGRFVSRDLLVKCPTKYETGEPSPAKS